MRLGRLVGWYGKNIKRKKSIRIRNLFIASLVLFFSGCATDGAYNISKVVYIGGKAVVIANADLLPPETLNKLERFDDMAARYDKARDSIKKAMDAVEDTNTSSIAGGTTEGTK